MLALKYYVSIFRFMLRVELMLVTIISSSTFAQSIDSIKQTTASEELGDRLTLLIYNRTIRSTNGAYRMDQSIVPNIKLNNWLKVELGFRLGETVTQHHAYSHYKLELQSKRFWKTARIIARLSDNIVRYKLPVFTKSNYLLVAEGQHPFARSFTALFAYGYVLTWQQNNLLESTPIRKGKRDFYSTYKLGIRYSLKDKGTVEALWGAYDVFNPYLLSEPFTQLSFDYYFLKRVSLYSYYRYEFNKRIDVPLNTFYTVGLKFHLL